MVPHIYLTISTKPFEKSKLRIGKDFVSSAVVLLANLRLFPGRSLPSRLRNAYKSFLSWCGVKKKNTNIADFSKREFKMISTHGFSFMTEHFKYIYSSLLACMCDPLQVSWYICFLHMSTKAIPCLRNNSFPTSTGGKGADTSIVSAWLEDAMKEMELWLLIS